MLQNIVIFSESCHFQNCQSTTMEYIAQNPTIFKAILFIIQNHIKEKQKHSLKLTSATFGKISIQRWDQHSNLRKICKIAS